MCITLTLPPGSREDGLEALDRSDWTDLWSQLMQELRTGVKVKICNDKKFPNFTNFQLRKVGESANRVSEFSLTPYEMLMDDIR